MSILKRKLFSKGFSSLHKGRKGEDLAVDYLKKRGFRVLWRNRTVCGVEIDIIAVEKNYLCFIEVKTRSSELAGEASEYVDKKKQEKYIRGASIISSEEKFQKLWIRFDVISITKEGDNFVVHHFEDAFGED